MEFIDDDSDESPAIEEEETLWRPGEDDADDEPGGPVYDPRSQDDEEEEDDEPRKPGRRRVLPRSRARVAVEMDGERIVHYNGLGRALTLCRVEIMPGSEPELWDACHGTKDKPTCERCMEIRMYISQPTEKATLETTTSHA